MTLPTVDQVRELRARIAAAQLHGPLGHEDEVNNHTITRGVHEDAFAYFADPFTGTDELDAEAAALIVDGLNALPGLLDALIVAAREIEVRRSIQGRDPSPQWAPIAAEPLSTEKT